MLNGLNHPFPFVVFETYIGTHANIWAFFCCKGDRHRSDMDGAQGIFERICHFQLCRGQTRSFDVLAHAPPCNLESVARADRTFSREELRFFNWWKESPISSPSSSLSLRTQRSLTHFQLPKSMLDGWKALMMMIDDKYRVCFSSIIPPLNPYLCNWLGSVQGIF